MRTLLDAPLAQRQIETGQIETGRIEAGRIEAGRIETGRIETGRIETGSHRDRRFLKASPTKPPALPGTPDRPGESPGR
jgi:hypothetical protein